MIYILGGIGVNFIWGLAFLVPYILTDTAPVILVFGRYLVYGLVSLGVMMVTRRWCVGPHWRMAFILAFSGNVGYFFFMAMAVQFAGISISALIIGILPITMALFGNKIEQTVPFRHLIFPLALILGGLAAINGYAIVQAETAQQTQNILWGIALAFMALALWTHYGVKNALYLKMHPDIQSLAWANMIGVASLVQVSVGLGLYVLFFGSAIIPSDPDEIEAVMGLSLLMGVVVSWLATHFWNLTSRHVPIVLVGQLIVFETLSSIIYEHLADQAWPHPITVMSAVAIVFAVIFSLRTIALNKSS